jgi:hypothetical protein
MIKFIKRTGFDLVEYIVSTEEEIAELPTNVGQGSTAFVIATSTAYMFDEEDKTWKAI